MNLAFFFAITRRFWTSLIIFRGAQILDSSYSPNFRSFSACLSELCVSKRPTYVNLGGQK